MKRFDSYGQLLAHIEANTADVGLTICLRDKGQAAVLSNVNGEPVAVKRGQLTLLLNEGVFLRHHIPVRVIRSRKPVKS